MFCASARIGFLCLVAAILLATDAVAGASSYENNVLKLPVPAGFKGPREETLLKSRIQTVGFVKRYPSSIHGTLLQITTIKIGAKLIDLSPGKKVKAATLCLKDLVTGVADRSTSFKVFGLKHPYLDGVKGSSVTWSGKARGHGMTGIMICVVVGPYFIAFHTQDFSDAPPSNRKQALSAIRAVKFKIR